MNVPIPLAPLAQFRTLIATAYPELEGSRLTLLTQGFDSVAVDVDESFIFKFPRHAEAERRLRTEARLLDAVRPLLAMTVPWLTLHDGPPLFSQHKKLRGEHLFAAQYEALPELARSRLAADMALFFAELHRLDPCKMEAAGAVAIGALLPPEEILRQALPLLPAELHDYAERTVAAWAALPPDPHGLTYGYFDGHGWNMAFDHVKQRLNGIYDFGDSGLGPLHQEFVQPSLISRDLAARIADEYEALTGRALDHERIELASGVLRLSELGGFAGEPERIPAALQAVADWAALPPR